MQHAGRLAREAHPAESRVPAQRAQRQGDVRDSLRHRRASHHAQHASRARRSSRFPRYAGPTCRTRTHGFSLLNDSKYGYDAKDNVLRLSLLRAPECPDPNADQGHHEFTYSLYPHAGTWREALTVRQGYEVNYPLMAITTTSHPGTLPPSQSFFGTQEDNVVITAIKKDADDSSLIVRFYEWAGKKGDIHLTLPQAASASWQTNLMEVRRRPAQPRLRPARSSPSQRTPYEIKTVKVQFAKP